MHGEQGSKPVRIVVNNLACRRSGRLVFADVSFTLSGGEALVVTGRNGAGKSSLLALLSDRLRPDAGAIDVEGIGDAGLMERLHLVGHRIGLKTALTAEENLSFARDLLGDPGLLPREALDVVGLGHAAPLPVAYLSAGQRRRVALARLLVAHRPLWLLDEPTAALDAETEHALFERYAAAARATDGGANGRITVLVSHRFSTVRMADLIIVLDGSRVVEVGDHATLVGAGGAYAELYGIQASSYR